MPRLVVARDHADEVVLEGELRDVVEGHGLAVVAEVHVEPHLRRDLVVVLLVLDAGDVREDLREAASFHADTFRGTLARVNHARYKSGMRDLHVERRELSGEIVEVWTIDREEVRNALSRSLVRAIGEAARRVETDREVRGVVLTGRGDRSFCAGADLKERRGMSEAEVRDFLAMYRTEFRFLDRLSKPVVAAIQGVAFGGGLELALTCDFRVAAPHAEMGLTEVSLAIIPGAGGTQRLTHLVGPAVAKELLLTSRRLSAEEALRLGIVNRVAREGQSAVEAALEFLEPMVTKAPIAVAAALEAVDAAVDQTLEEGLVTELRLYERTLVSRDRLEALAAFAEKRPPRFEGR